MNDKVDWEYLEQHEPFESRGSLIAVALGLCCCGSGEDFKLVEDTLRFAAADSEVKHTKTGGEWDKGCYRSAGHELAMKVLDSANLVEHGTGIGWAWATEDGKRLLKMIDAIPEDEK